MSDRRENTRYKALGLSTPYGEVMDISDAGLGVFRKGRVVCAVGDEVNIQLSHGTTDIKLNAKVARVSNVGLFRHEIGFEFVGVDQATLDQLHALTTNACSEFTGPRCYIAA